MALLPTAANTEENSEGLGDRSALPAGDYLAHIIKSEMKETKESIKLDNQSGFYLSIHYCILEGERKGRMFFANLNLKNKNPVAVEIANKELNSICQACDLQGVEDSDELHQIPMCITLKVDPATAQWPEGNSITAYKPADEYEGEPEVEGASSEEPVIEAEAVEAEPEVTQGAVGEANDPVAMKKPWE